ncbi:SapC family protein [Sandaracinobacter sp. RS1-74]|uniref:SapC family protein n=1 Tax=Sandaracinobacteroides sayramensis TaxID=2913411 RepID=UPI001EDAB843|nr:SapC family protein [Sandaracinobacteroides sayramensis]MCG2839424.1 SapC family protein [Sandaracinobacteroides sayramensis]
MQTSAEAARPLFYSRPEVLSPERHANLKLGAGNHGFAAETNAVPLAIVEFASAMRHYPIVFAASDGFPVALLGLESGNRFVEAGAWAEGVYVPAYVRRYPFIFVDRADDSFLLAIDRAAEQLSEAEGNPLFVNGKPSAQVEGMLGFCRDFHGAHLQTRAFAEALAARELLVEQQADAELPSGRKMRLSGFRVVDRVRFEALPDDAVLEWHHKGWLALLHFHFASLERFADLMAREDRKADAGENPDAL